jgi:hypothetical protein
VHVTDDAETPLLAWILNSSINVRSTDYVYHEDRSFFCYHHVLFKGEDYFSHPTIDMINHCGWRRKSVRVCPKVCVI